MKKNPFILSSSNFKRNDVHYQLGNCKKIRHDTRRYIAYTDD